VSETDDRAELFLVDGNSLAYRAFFALPDTMATSDGRPSNAIFGLASMLVKLISEHRPRQIVVVWDAGMSGREEVYPEYKSHRPSKPDLLKQQWPDLVRLVAAFGYLNVSVDGYEADDVIATLATWAGRKHDLKMTSVAYDAATIASYDCVLISTAHSKVDYSVIAKNAKLVVDTRDALRSFEKDMGARLVRA
jgi:DNA polymerase-1